LGKKESFSTEKIESNLEKRKSDAMIFDAKLASFFGGCRGIFHLPQLTNFFA